MADRSKWRALTATDMPSDIKKTYADRWPDRELVKAALQRLYQAQSETSFDWDAATQSERNDFTDWINSQWQSEGFPDQRLYPAWEPVFYRTISDKIKWVADRPCTICDLRNRESDVHPHLMPFRLKPYSRQNLPSKVFKAMQAAFKDRMNAPHIGKLTGKLCVRFTFVLVPTSKRRDKDLDNMAKATLDAIARGSGFNDVEVAHLDLAKFVGDGDEEYMLLKIGPSYLHDHTNVVAPVVRHGWGVDEIDLENYM